MRLHALQSWLDGSAAGPQGAAVRARRRWVLPFALAAATAVALLAWPRATRRTDTALPTPSLTVLHTAGGAAEPVRGAIAASDGLLFSYSNPGATYSYLMVFAVDRHRRVHWYYPAHQNAAENPEAVPIDRQRLGVELREAIRQPLPPGRVELHALFLARPASVREIEAQIARRAPDVAGAYPLTWVLDVRP
jgi:hypothetical protein